MGSKKAQCTGSGNSSRQNIARKVYLEDIREQKGDKSQEAPATELKHPIESIAG